MKKRKIYEISVIDKTYSKTISDETKFYTSDTSLELVFKLKETEYTFESAEIVLLNIDDGAFNEYQINIFAMNYLNRGQLSQQGFERLLQAIENIKNPPELEELPE